MVRMSVHRHRSLICVSTVIISALSVCRTHRKMPTLINDNRPPFSYLNQLVATVSAHLLCPFDCFPNGPPRKWIFLLRSCREDKSDPGPASFQESLSAWVKATPPPHDHIIARTPRHLVAVDGRKDRTNLIVEYPKNTSPRN
jgi:hypothetical protein